MPESRAAGMRERRAAHRAAVVAELAKLGLGWGCAWCQEPAGEGVRLDFWPPHTQSLAKMVKITTAARAAREIVALLRGHGGRRFFLCERHTAEVQDAMKRHNCGPYWTPKMEPYINGSMDGQEDELGTRLQGFAKLPRVTVLQSEEPE